MDRLSAVCFLSRDIAEEKRSDRKMEKINNGQGVKLRGNIFSRSETLIAMGRFNLRVQKLLLIRDECNSVGLFCTHMVIA